MLRRWMLHAREPIQLISMHYISSSLLGNSSITAFYRHMYNMDEKGFLIGVVSKGKRIFSCYQYEKGGQKQRLQDGNREWITTIG